MHVSQGVFSFDTLQGKNFFLLSIYTSSEELSGNIYFVNAKLSNKSRVKKKN